MPTALLTSMCHNCGHTMNHYMCSMMSSFIITEWSFLLHCAVEKLQILHSAHQRVSAMESRACAIIFWPGIAKDIQSLRDNCIPCNRNAPSQVARPHRSWLPYLQRRLNQYFQIFSTLVDAITYLQVIAFPDGLKFSKLLIIRLSQRLTALYPLLELFLLHLESQKSCPVMGDQNLEPRLLQYS